MPIDILDNLGNNKGLGSKGAPIPTKEDLTLGSYRMFYYSFNLFVAIEWVIGIKT